MHGKHRYPMEWELLDSGSPWGSPNCQFDPSGDWQELGGKWCFLSQSWAFLLPVTPREVLCMGIVHRIISWSFSLVSADKNAPSVSAVMSQWGRTGSDGASTTPPGSVGPSSGKGLWLRAALAFPAGSANRLYWQPGSWNMICFSFCSCKPAHCSIKLRVYLAACQYLCRSSTTRGSITAGSWVMP